MSGENEVVVTEEVVETTPSGVQPRNTTQKTWPAFESRWTGTIVGKLIKDAEGLLKDIHETSIEFDMQQLVNAQNYVGMAIGELRKCIGYEENNLTSAIGPRPVTVVAPAEDPVVPEEEVIPEEEFATPPEEPVSPAINLFKNPS